MRDRARDTGLQRLKGVLDLDPNLVTTRLELARQAALDGNAEAFARMVDALAERQADRTIPILQIRLREAAWRRDRDRMVEICGLVPPSNEPAHLMLQSYAGIALGTLDPNAGAARAEEYLARVKNPRFQTLIHQFLTEALAFAGALELAEKYVQRSAETRLIDLTWLDMCPLLEPLRGTQGFARARTLVVHRIRPVNEP